MINIYELRHNLALLLDIDILLVARYVFQKWIIHGRRDHCKALNDEAFERMACESCAE